MTSNSLRWIASALLLLALLIIGVMPARAEPPAQSPTIHVVRAGESLAAIAARYGTTAAALAQLNGLANPNFIYAGQRLKLPGAAVPAASAGVNAAQGGAIHIVQAGQSLAAIAARYGVSAAAIVQANGLRNPNLIFAGQRLIIPGAQSSAPAQPAAAPAANPASAGRWIEVILSTQTLVAYEGSRPVFTTKVSTGLPGTPTVVGRFAILSKYPAVHMSGPGYSLPNVPWTMFFYKGYALHGAYWHNKFGQPMSHGCVNLSVSDAAWLYQFASVGTPVVVHY
jgi:lipoprotein-anchoring transpeptidase ErfK/SrfK